MESCWGLALCSRTGVPVERPHHCESSASVLVEGSWERSSSLAPCGRLRDCEESPGMTIEHSATQLQQENQNFIVASTMGEAPRTVADVKTETSCAQETICLCCRGRTGEAELTILALLDWRTVSVSQTSNTELGNTVEFLFCFLFILWLCSGSSLFE